MKTATATSAHASIAEVTPTLTPTIGTEAERDEARATLAVLAEGVSIAQGQLTPTPPGVELAEPGLRFEDTTTTATKGD